MHTSLRKRVAATREPLSRASLTPSPSPASPKRHTGGDKPAGAKAVYELSLQFDVYSALQLWHAAARRLGDGGLSPLDIEMTIGLAADPSIADCLATLVLPRHASGCDLLDVRIGPALPIDDRFAAPFPSSSEH